MHGRQRLHRADGVGREQPHQRRHDAAELGIALREVLRTVELVEKEVGRTPVARVGQQARVRAREALLLVAFQGRHLGGQGRRGSALAPLRVDGVQGLQDAGGDVGHGTKGISRAPTEAGP